MLSVTLRVCLAALLLIVSSFALAERAAAGAAPPAGTAAAARRPLGWQTQLGVGTIVNPEFVGADEYQVIPIPYFEFRYLDERGTKFFVNVPQGVGGYFYRHRSGERRFDLGAAIAPGFNVRGDEIDGLEEVDAAVEARLMIEAGGRHWGAQATFAQDVGNGHEGAYLDLSLSWRDRIGQRGGFFALGPVMRIGDDDYNQTLFSVSAAEAVASGLPAYQADGGLERAGVQALVSLPLGKSRWRWTTIGRVSRLFDDPADSPVVVEENQLFLLTALTRRF